MSQNEAKLRKLPKLQLFSFKIVVSSVRAIIIVERLFEKRVFSKWSWVTKFAVEENDGHVKLSKNNK